MLNSLLKKTTLVILLFLSYATIALASQPTLVFSVAPVAQDMELNSTQTLVYTVQNNVPTSPIPISALVNQSGGLVQNTVSNDCNGLVPAAGTCNITVIITPLGTQGIAQQTLFITYGDRRAVLNSEQMSFNIVQPKLTFVTQPAAEDMLFNNTQVLTYRVRNSSTILSAVINTTAFAPASPLVTTTITNTCNSTVLPEGECDINVEFDSMAMPGDVGGVLQIIYDNSTALLQAGIQFSIREPLLIFSQKPIAQGMGISSTQQLDFVVKNLSPGTPAPIDSTILTPASALITNNIVNDCGGTVPAMGSCTISVTINSLATGGLVNTSLVIAYDGNTQTLTAPIQFGIHDPFLVFTTQPTAQNMQPDSEQTLVYVVSNTSATLSAPLTTAFFTPAPAFIQTTVTNNCSDLVPASGTCNITLTINSLGNTGSVSGNLFTVYNNATGLLISDIQSFLINDKARSVTFDNECPFTVWLGIAGSATNSRLNNPGNPTECITTTDCFLGQTCVFTGTIKECTWNNPAPSGNGNFQLSTGDSTDVSFIEFPNGIDEVWAGEFAGRTGCTGAGCETAGCSADDQACTPGQKFSRPSTRVDIIMNTTPNDKYDMTLVNGSNIAMSFAPNNTVVDPANPFSCGTAGNTATVNGLGACSWVFTPPSNDYQKVPSGGANCTNNGDCSSGEVCGMSSSNIIANSSQRTCGTTQGYWSANEMCQVNNTYANVNASVDCPTNAGVAAPFNTLTFAELYFCTSSSPDPVLNSCYSGGAVSEQCCGCVNWDTQGITMPNTASIVAQCDPPSTASWNGNILPTLLWTKQACPSGKTYPSDGASSGFSCFFANNVNKNTTNYTVTFCPGGLTGQP